MLKWTPKSEEDLLWIREHITKDFGANLAIQTIEELIFYCENPKDKNLYVVYVCPSGKSLLSEGINKSEVF